MTVTGLVVGAAGIAVLWASGVGFPVYTPPGLLSPPPWSPGVLAVRQEYRA